MTNPTLEQRAREIYARELDRDGEETAAILWRANGPAHPGSVNARIIRAMLTFSHTGVEQAIEACAEVAEGCYADPKWPARDRATGQSIAAAIRATLPAQSPDDIAYAGAAPSPLNVEGLVETLRFIAGWCTDGREPSEALASIGECARKALASLSPDGER